MPILAMVLYTVHRTRAAIGDRKVERVLPYEGGFPMHIRGGHSVSFRLETLLATMLATVLDMLDMLATV